MDNIGVITEAIKVVINSLHIDDVESANISQGMNERGLTQLNIAIEFKPVVEREQEQKYYSDSEELTASQIREMRN